MSVKQSRKIAISDRFFVEVRGRVGMNVRIRVKILAGAWSRLGFELR